MPDKILIPEFILVEVYNLLEADVVDLLEKLDNIIKKYFERKADVVKEKWRQDLVKKMLYKEKGMRLGEPIQFDFRHWPDMDYSIDGMSYKGCFCDVKIPEWLNKDVKESFTYMLRQKDEIIKMFVNIKTKKDLNSFFKRYIDDFKNHRIDAVYYNHQKHDGVFDDYLKGKEEQGFHLEHLELSPGHFFGIICKLNNIPEDERGDFYTKEKIKYRFLEFLFLMQQEGAVQIKRVKNKAKSHPVYDSWKMLIRVKTYDAYSNQLVKINGFLDKVLYYDYQKHTVEIEGGVYKLTPVLKDVLEIFIGNPNQIISIEKFFAEKSLQDNNLVRKRISRLKKRVPPLSKYMPSASKNDSGYILKIPKNKIVKVK